MNETVPVLSGQILDTWSNHAWDNGLQVDRLDDLDKVTVQTENSIYEITVISPHAGEILVRGGRFFPEFTAARLAGCSLRGSFLKMRGIYTGFNLEFNLDGKTIITSRVRTVALHAKTDKLPR